LISLGKLDFKSKILAFFNGGIKSTVEDVYAKTLENLDKTLDFELNTFDIKVNAIVNRPGGFYLKQSIYCKEKSVAKNLKIMIPKMQRFFKKNNIVSTGKPFVIYNKYDKTNDIIGLSVCIPVRDSLRFSPGSDIEWANMLPFTAVKTTLKGDRSHTQKAWAKTFDYITKQKLVRASSQQVIEVYVKGVDDEKQPSKWVTEIYVPVLPKVVPRKRTYSKQGDSTAVVKPATPVEETATP
jgi:effector-binding domain-containing protein